MKLGLSCVVSAALCILCAPPQASATPAPIAPTPVNWQTGWLDKDVVDGCLKTRVYLSASMSEVRQVVWPWSEAGVLITDTCNVDDAGMPKIVTWYSGEETVVVPTFGPDMSTGDFHTTMTVYAADDPTPLPMIIDAHWTATGATTMRRMAGPDGYGAQNDLWMARSRVATATYTITVAGHTYSGVTSGTLSRVHNLMVQRG